jgi:hypothetical protein
MLGSVYMVVIQLLNMGNIVKINVVILAKKKNATGKRDIV